MPSAGLQARLYRLRWWFSHLEYNLTVNLLFTTLMRNLVVRYLTAQMLCFYFYHCMAAVWLL